MAAFLKFPLKIVFLKKALSIDYGCKKPLQIFA